MCNICGEKVLITDRKFIVPYDPEAKHPLHSLYGSEITCAEVDAQLFRNSEYSECQIYSEFFGNVCCDPDYKPCTVCANGDAPKKLPLVDVAYPGMEQWKCADIGFGATVEETAGSDSCWLYQYLAGLYCGCPDVPELPKDAACILCPDGNPVDFPWASVNATSSGGLQSEVPCHEVEFFSVGLDGRFENLTALNPPWGTAPKPGDRNDFCLEELQFPASKLCCSGVGDCVVCPHGLRNPNHKYLVDGDLLYEWEEPYDMTCEEGRDLLRDNSAGEYCETLKALALGRFGCECLPPALGNKSHSSERFYQDLQFKSAGTMGQGHQDGFERAVEVLTPRFGSEDASTKADIFDQEPEGARVSVSYTVDYESNFVDVTQYPDEYIKYMALKVNRDAFVSDLISRGINVVPGSASEVRLWQEDEEDENGGSGGANVGLIAGVSIAAFACIAALLLLLARKRHARLRARRQKEDRRDGEVVDATPIPTLTVANAVVVPVSDEPPRDDSAYPSMTDMDVHEPPLPSAPPPPEVPIGAFDQRSNFQGASPAATEAYKNGDEAAKRRLRKISEESKAAGRPINFTPAENDAEYETIKTVKVSHGSGKSGTDGIKNEAFLEEVVPEEPRHPGL